MAGAAVWNCAWHHKCHSAQLSPSPPPIWFITFHHLAQRQHNYKSSSCSSMQMCMLIHASATVLHAHARTRAQTSWGMHILSCGMFGYANQRTMLAKWRWSNAENDGVNGHFALTGSTGAPSWAPWICDFVEISTFSNHVNFHSMWPGLRQQSTDLFFTF